MDKSAVSSIKMGSEKNFGIVFAIFFLVVSLWPVMFGKGDLRVWALIIATVFFVLAFAKPGLMKPLNVMWFRFGILLGAIIAPIIMGLIFFLVVTPIGIIMRATGKDLLKQKLDPEAKSYWIKRQDPMGSMKNQY